MINYQNIPISLPVDLKDFDETFEGFEKYIAEIGAKRVSARELLTPNHEAIAKSLGYTWFLPPKADWANLVPLIALFEHIRDVTKHPIRVRNWWRPADYNAKVGGASKSDHITAHAFDCDFNSADLRRVAESELVKIQRQRADLKVSLGLGNRTIHIGALSPAGRRTWKYNDYQP